MEGERASSHSPVDGRVHVSRFPCGVQLPAVDVQCCSVASVENARWQGFQRAEKAASPQHASRSTNRCSVSVRRASSTCTAGADLGVQPRICRITAGAQRVLPLSETSCMSLESIVQQVQQVQREGERESKRA